MPERMTDTQRAVSRRAAVLVAAIATLMTACSNDSPSAPTIPAADLGNCTNLETPAGSTLAAHAFATGVQIYRWNDTSWVFVSPSAVLTSDAARTKMIAIHYSGPTWQSVGGDRVIAAAGGSCKASPDAIPWLLLNATATDPSGTFSGVKYIQRLNTVGGLAPSTPGSPGEVVSVPYAAEYFFYR
jgi:hypothetical protein